MEEKTCRNCRYYLQHYAKNSRFIIKVECGHCTHSELWKKMMKEHGKVRKNCEYWEPQSLQKEKRRKKIKEALIDMEEALADIKIILQSDEE